MFQLNKNSANCTIVNVPPIVTHLYRHLKKSTSAKHGVNTSTYISSMKRNSMMKNNGDRHHVSHIGRIGI